MKGPANMLNAEDDIRVNGLPIDYNTVPGSGVMMQAVIRYIEHGAPPGHFVTAVIQNNLFEAMRRADLENRALLHAWCSWFYNKAPSMCYGSKDKMDMWMEARTVAYEARMEA